MMTSKSAAVETLCCPSIAEHALTEEDAANFAHVFAALSDPVRLRLFSIVASADEVCSCNLEEPLGRSQPTVSHHTKILVDAGLIQGEKRGRWVWWTAVPERLKTIQNLLGSS